MKKYLFLSALFIAKIAPAQTAADSLFVVPMSDGWMLMEPLAAGENIAVLARRFFVPPAILAAANAQELSAPLREGSTLFIPLAGYNLTHQLPQKGQVDVRPLYYKTEKEGERLSRIGRAGGVGERDLRDWNHLEDSDLAKGQTLLVGGLRYDATGTFGPKVKPTMPPLTGTGKGAAPPAENGAEITKGPVSTLGDFIERTDAALETAAAKGDPAKENSPSPDAPEIPAIPKQRRRSVEAVSFEELEAAGVGFVEEKGTAVFFSSKSPYTIYAFHNIAGRGTVIKITNPLNGHAVYAKVLGPLPPTPQYHKALLGISSKAQRLLGCAGDARMWCEVAYVGY